MIPGIPELIGGVFSLFGPVKNEGRYIDEPENPTKPKPRTLPRNVDPEDDQAARIAAGEVSEVDREETKTTTESTIKAVEDKSPTKKFKSSVKEATTEYAKYCRTKTGQSISNASSAVKEAMLPTTEYAKHCSAKTGEIISNASSEFSERWASTKNLDPYLVRGNKDMMNEIFTMSPSTKDQYFNPGLALDPNSENI